jgi:hypothetical protein
LIEYNVNMGLLSNYLRGLASQHPVRGLPAELVIPYYRFESCRAYCLRSQKDSYLDNFLIVS